MTTLQLTPRAIDAAMQYRPRLSFNSDIFHITLKDNSHLTIYDLKEAFKRKTRSPHLSDKKCDIILDISNIRSTTKGVQELLQSEQMYNETKRLCIIVKSPISRMIGNISLHFRKPKYEIRLFTHFHEAEDWLLS